MIHYHHHPLGLQSLGKNITKTRFQWTLLWYEPFSNTHQCTPFPKRTSELIDINQSIKSSTYFDLESTIRDLNFRYATFDFAVRMKYALESGCCNSPDAGLITAATQYCKMYEAYSRAYPWAITPGLLLHEIRLKRWMVSYNDLGVPVHELPIRLMQHNKQCNAYLDQRLKTISN